MAGPSTDAIRRERARLFGHLRARVEAHWQLAYPTEADRLEIAIPRTACLGHQVSSHAPEQIRLDDCFGNELLDPTIKAIEIIGLGSERPIELPIQRLDHGGRE